MADLIQEELRNILELQKKWCSNEPGGERADLRGAYLKGAYLRGANLEGAYLGGANLEGAYLEEANLKEANLKEANLRGAYLKEANLRGANLEGAYLGGAYLERANLEGADLEEAYLEEAYLEEANLEGANLRGAHLRGANLFGANLENTTYGEGVVISAAPLQISGLEWEIIIFDNHMKIGCELHPIAEWATFKDTRIKLMDSHAIAFWHEHKSMIMTCAELHSKSALEAKGSKENLPVFVEKE